MPGTGLSQRSAGKEGQNINTLKLLMPGRKESVVPDTSTAPGCGTSEGLLRDPVGVVSADGEAAAAKGQSR